MKFLTFERARMKLQREIGTKLNIPSIPEQITFKKWDISMANPLASIIAQNHFNSIHPDSYTFCNYKGLDGSKKFLEDIVSGFYGTFQPNFSWGCPRSGVN